MNGKQAKAGRRYARLRAAVVQAHSRLHNDDVEGCHELLHQALETGSVDVAPIGSDHHLDFDESFRALCRRNHVEAAYVLVAPDGQSGGRLLAGGAARLCELMDRAIRKEIA